MEFHGNCSMHFCADMQTGWKNATCLINVQNICIYLIGLIGSELFEAC